MRGWILFLIALLAAIGGAVLAPREGAEDAPAPPAGTAAPPAGNAVPAPSLRLRTSPPPPTASAAAPSPTTRKPAPAVVFVDSPLESPEREWRPILENRALGANVRTARLLTLAETFSTRRHFDHAARTLDVLDERTSELSPDKARIRLQRAWNEYRRGEERAALSLAEAVTGDEAAGAAVRARGAYLQLLVAFGLGEMDSARAALGALEVHATPAEKDMLADATRRFGAQLRPLEDR